LEPDDDGRTVADASRMVSTDASSLNMKTPPNNAYFQRAREIIGDRSQAEIDYDNSVVAHLSTGMDIKRAIAAANERHPKEALQPGPDDWADLAARYQYIKEHKDILKRLGMRE